MARLGQSNKKNNNGQLSLGFIRLLLIGIVSISILCNDIYVIGFSLKTHLPVKTKTTTAAATTKFNNDYYYQQHYTPKGNIKLSLTKSSSLSTDTAVSKTSTNDIISRRKLVSSSSSSLMTMLLVMTQQPKVIMARTPGSKNVKEAVEQVVDAVKDLRMIQENWSTYAIVDNEGRAGSTDAARRILGGIKPQGGITAIEVAKNTPCYRIDIAFSVIRDAVLNELPDDKDWITNFDLLRFEELAESIIYQIQNADSNFYSVLFAQKGTTQINGIYKEAKQQINQGIIDLDEMITLLQDVNAPGI